MLAWVILAYMVLNTLGNFASVSNIECFVFGPMTILMADQAALHGLLRKFRDLDLPLVSVIRMEAHQTK